MGEIARAVDLTLEREVAVKSLLSKHMNRPDSVARFLLEAKVTAQLQHPNIPAVYELGKTAEGNPYFTMALVEGETLSEIVDRLKRGDAETHRNFSIARRVQIIQGVCDAIHYAHSRGYLHRDLKPDNIMIGSFGEVQVVDWGFVRRMASEGEDALKPGLTRVGTVVGSPAYAAPEQIAGDSEILDARTDVYGLGALLYEFTTLHPPHQAKSVRELMLSVMTRSPPRADSYHHEIQGRVPTDLSEVISIAMAPVPDERMASAQELKAHLQQVLEGRTPKSPLAPPPSSPLRRAIWQAWILSPLVLMAYIAWAHFPK